MSTNKIFGFTTNGISLIYKMYLFKNADVKAFYVDLRQQK